MHTRLLTGLGGSLLLLAATLAPSALGHDERGSFGTANGVSGRYIGAAGLAIPPSHSFASGSAAFYPIIDLGSTLAVGAMLCDIEVLGDGTAPFPQDEETVDGAAGGSVPDTFDDGGYGGACHTNHYLHGSYNTPGCPAATAHADDLSGVDTWIAASCDWKTVVGGTPRADIFAACAVNSFLSGQPLSIVDCTLQFIYCVTNQGILFCLQDGTEVCGSDFISDGRNYGHGSVGVPYPTASAQSGSVAYGLDPFGECLAGDSTAQVFVFEAVVAEPGIGVHVHPATTGEIWQV